MQEFAKAGIDMLDYAEFQTVMRNCPSLKTVVSIQYAALALEQSHEKKDDLIFNSMCKTTVLRDLDIDFVNRLMKVQCPKSLLYDCAMFLSHFTLV